MSCVPRVEASFELAVVAVLSEVARLRVVDAPRISIVLREMPPPVADTVVVIALVPRAVARPIPVAPDNELPVLMPVGVPGIPS